MAIFDYRKLTFSCVNAFLFLLIASPFVYRMVGSALGLKYDGETDNNRTSLLFVHSLVFGLITLITINVYGGGGTGE